MAEINIQKRERAVWPWLLAGGFLLALLWFLFARNPGDVRTGMAGDTTFRDTTGAAGTLVPPNTVPPPR